MSRGAIITREIDVAALMAEVQSSDCGAVSAFAGTVRDVNDGRSVTSIDYSAYTSMAESQLASIIAEAEGRFGVSALVVEHRVGTLAIGDVSVAIVAAHAHRAPALDCTRFVIEEIKRRVPIWKREHYADGTREWIDPTASHGIATA
jgi:molybdopterin synthase catalytic subunit